MERARRRQNAICLEVIKSFSSSSSLSPVAKSDGGGRVWKCIQSPKDEVCINASAGKIQEKKILSLWFSNFRTQDDELLNLKNLNKYFLGILFA